MSVKAMFFPFLAIVTKAGMRFCANQPTKNGEWRIIFRFIELFKTAYSVGEGLDPPLHYRQNMQYLGRVKTLPYWV